MALRPSTIQRLLNFRLLVAEFAVRDLGYDEAGVLLACSSSGARNYINRLLDAGVLAPRRTRGADGKDLNVFRLNPDPQVARGFLAMMERQPRSVERAPGQAMQHAAAAVAGVSAVPAPPCPAADAAGPGRDPLVAALFGHSRAGPRP